MIGYSYQEAIAHLLLAKMDVERAIKKIEIEADVAHNFDDLRVLTKDNLKIFCQMKDFENIQLSDITINDDEIRIKGKSHCLSEDCNVVFIKNIVLETNSCILGIPSYLTNSVHIISMTREEAKERIEGLYEIDFSRISIMQKFFARRFDNRKLCISLNELPPIEIYSVELMDKTIQLENFKLEDSKILMIEGKPGVGKSHLVNQLELEGKALLYRFWISNQDSKYKERLEYRNFIFNLIKDLFQNYKNMSEDDIIEKLIADKRTLIIDGLDHVENYNSQDLKLFIEFIEKVAKNSKVIVLSRPLRAEINWTKKKLGNWNFDQTNKYLEELFHISDYKIIKGIYDITQGYPILVNFIGRYYLNNNELPDVEKLDSLNEYYQGITENLQTRIALSIFLSSYSYFMYSEINNLLDSFASAIIQNFIRAHPYLFEIKLNRIALVHDSLNTFLRNHTDEWETHANNIRDKVFESLLKGEKRYISRYYFFQFDKDQHYQILSKYADIKYFDDWIKNCVDIEAVQAFYSQLRDSLNKLEPSQLTVYQYYDFVLIQNILSRNYISGRLEFIYIYVKSLILNGYSEEEIVSSGYVFAMLYFLREGDYRSLEVKFSDYYYDTEGFDRELKSIIQSEDELFGILESPYNIASMYKELKNLDEITARNWIVEIFISLYIHDNGDELFRDWENSLNTFLHNEDKEPLISLLKKIELKFELRDRWISTIINKIVYKLKILGVLKENNQFIELSLEAFINNGDFASPFDLQNEIFDYLRLSLKYEKQIDIESIYKLFLSYYPRKDYTVINIDASLMVFQKHQLLNMQESISIIIGFQVKSEKGIRHILNDYLERLSLVDFKEFLDTFDTNDLKMSLSSLPPELLNITPPELLVDEVDKLMRNHYYSRTIKLYEVKNLIHSLYGQEVINVLKFHNYKISISDTDDLPDILQEKSGLIEKSQEKQSSSHENSSKESYEKGYLTKKDIQFIIEQKLTPSEVAALGNGYYASFSDLSLYDHYEKEELLASVNEIFYNAILSEARTIDYSADLYYLVGNIPYFLSDYVGYDVDIKKLFESFILFVELSGITFR